VLSEPFGADETHAAPRHAAASYSAVENVDAAGGAAAPDASAHVTDHA